MLPCKSRDMLYIDRLYACTLTYKDKIIGYMGHRGFGQASRISRVKQPSKEENYSRAPHPNARNYFEEMAPVNGIRELTEVELVCGPSSSFISFLKSYTLLERTGMVGFTLPY